jgi:O-Antigen ligase
VALVWRTPLTWPGLTFAAIMLVAALAAPAFTGNALRFTARLFVAGLIFLLTVNAILTERAARLVVGVWAAVAAVVAGVAVLEAAQVQPVMDALTVFRPGFHVVGGQLRATSTLLYPTVTSMYLEVPFALGLWLLVDAIDRRRFALAGSCFVILLLIGAGIVATFTRAGLMSLALSVAVVGGFRLWRTRRVDGAQVALLALAAALVAVVFASRSPDRLLTRLSTEGSQAWYGATYQAPGELRFVPGGRYAVPVTLVNTGRLEWSSGDYPPFALSYHWVVAGSSNVVQFNGLRTPFPMPVAPGSAVSMNAVVIAPANPGWYDLVWDVVHEYRAWLSTENVVPGRTRVRVEGPPTRLRADAMPRLPAAAVRPPRSTLWQAALQIAAEHPVTGIGPDNFRLAYGTYVGLPRWDTRVHANSLYLEVLAGAGVPGLAALLWLIAAAGRAIVRRWQATPLPLATASAAAFAVWATVAGHGLVDTFLAFTPTYVVFAVAAGLALCPGLAKAEKVPGTIARKA